MVSAGRSDSPATEIKDLWRWVGKVSLLHPDSWCDTSGVRVAPVSKRLNKLCDQKGWHFGLSEWIIRLYCHCRDSQRQPSEVYVASGEPYDRKIYVWCEVRCSEMWNENQDSCLLLSQAKGTVLYCRVMVCVDSLHIHVYICICIYNNRCVYFNILDGCLL